MTGSENNNIYQHFASDYIKERSQGLSFTELYSQFKLWFKESFPGLKVPDRSTVKNQLTQGGWI